MRCPSNTALLRITLIRPWIADGHARWSSLQELHRRAVAQRGVAATPVVELRCPQDQQREQIGPRICSRHARCAARTRSFFRLSQRLSVGALSQQSPFRLIDALMPYSASLAFNAWLAYWLPRSLCNITPTPGLRRSRCLCGHPRLDRPANDLAVEQIQHDGQVQPVFAGLDVGDASLVHTRFAASGVKLHACRFCAISIEYGESAAYPFTDSKKRKSGQRPLFRLTTNGRQRLATHSRYWQVMVAVATSLLASANDTTIVVPDP